MNKDNRVINAAILGFGTVGSGVYKISCDMKEELLHRTGAYLNIKKVLVRDKTKKRKALI